jgi:hypothetical protein
MLIERIKATTKRLEEGETDNDDTLLNFRWITHYKIEQFKNFFGLLEGAHKGRLADEGFRFKKKTIEK